MKKHKKKRGIPKFASDEEEAKWWSCAEGRAFLNQLPGAGVPIRSVRSKLVTKLARAISVQAPPIRST
jgi:hypothetical protein